MAVRAVTAAGEDAAAAAEPSSCAPASVRPSGVADEDHVVAVAEAAHEAAEEDEDHAVVAVVHPSSSAVDQMATVRPVPGDACPGGEVRGGASDGGGEKDQRRAAAEECPQRRPSASPLQAESADRDERRDDGGWQGGACRGRLPLTAAGEAWAQREQVHLDRKQQQQLHQKEVEAWHLQP